jgi:4-hydroxy-tetrahydrodipicolinate synthase
MADLRLEGVYTALATPFSADGAEIDWASYERLVQSQLDCKITGVVPCGTTGETSTLSEAEQRALIERTVRQVKGRAVVLAGTGSNDTKKAIQSTRAAFEAGADAAMLVMPYYNRPSQEGLLRHVSLVAQAVPGPIVLYNVPARTSVDLSVETVLRILDLCPNVVGLKDASGGVLYTQDLLLKANDRVSVMSGDDPLTLPLVSVGARGVISVTSNVYPKGVAESVDAALSGQLDLARRLHRALYPIHRGLFLEASPSPVKAALVARGVFTEATVRPPLAEATPTLRGRLAELMAAYEASA